MTHERQANERFHFRRNKTAHGVLLACISMSGALGAGASYAQVAAPAAPASAASAAATSTLEQVTVTARKRKELLLDVPISMQAFTAQELQAQGAKNLQDIKNESGFSFAETTNASTVSGGRAWDQLSFRGLVGDSMSFYDSSGGVFIDGIAVSSGLGSVNFADVARVEVLKGPQNVYFGRSTFGGAINIITREPATKLQGEVNTSITNRGSFDTDATIEGPLVDGLVRGRVTVASSHKAAIAQATDGGNLGEQGTKSVSGTLYFTPMDDLWIRLRGYYQKDDDSSAAVGTVVFDGNTSCAGKYFNGSNAQGQSQPFTPAVPYNCGTVPTAGAPGVRLTRIRTSRALSTLRSSTTASTRPTCRKRPAWTTPVSPARRSAARGNSATTCPIRWTWPSTSATTSRRR